MIGGVDILIPTRAGKSSMEVAVRAVRKRWPSAVFENGLTGDHYAYFWQIPFADVVEIFVYRDSVAADAWDAKGAVPELYNTMIHIIADEELVSVVVDSRDADMDVIVKAISSGLRDDIHHLAAELVTA